LRYIISNNFELPAISGYINRQGYTTTKIINLKIFRKLNFSQLTLQFRDTLIQNSG
jgi:hypothetical protein